MKTDVAFRNELLLQRLPKGVVQKDWHPGCTAIVALIVRDTLFVANAGDCRTILCRGGSAIALSEVCYTIFMCWVCLGHMLCWMFMLSVTIILFQITQG